MFVISDVNGNLVEYVLDVIVDTSKMAGNKPTNDSPIQLRITPKAQWPLQRFITSDEVRYPIAGDNPLIWNGGCGSIGYARSWSGSTNGSGGLRKASTGSSGGDSCAGSYSPGAAGGGSVNFHSPSSTSLSFMTALGSLPQQQQATSLSHPSSEWIKQIEVNTHIGPHRRLFMGPQFAFKTFNSNLTTTMLGPSSSAVQGGDNETPIIDLSGDIELNSLDLSAAMTSKL